MSKFRVQDTKQQEGLRALFSYAKGRLNTTVPERLALDIAVQQDGRERILSIYEGANLWVLNEAYVRFYVTLEDQQVQLTCTPGNSEGVQYVDVITKYLGEQTRAPHARNSRMFFPVSYSPSYA